MKIWGVWFWQHSLMVKNRAFFKTTEIGHFSYGLSTYIPSTETQNTDDKGQGFEREKKYFI